MAIVHPDTVREMSVKEIDEELASLRAQLAAERAIESTGGSMERKVQIREIKRAIARLLTIRKQKTDKGEVKEVQ